MLAEEKRKEKGKGREERRFYYMVGGPKVVKGTTQEPVIVTITYGQDEGLGMPSILQQGNLPAQQLYATDTTYYQARKCGS